LKYANTASRGFGKRQFASAWNPWLDLAAKIISGKRCLSGLSENRWL
jgi:hypothetical protein